MQVLTLDDKTGLRIPPHSLEAEMALLGSIMLRPDAIYEVLDIVIPASFYFEKHKTIFETMLELFGKHQPIDILSLSSGDGISVKVIITFWCFSSLVISRVVSSSSAL